MSIRQPHRKPASHAKSRFAIAPWRVCLAMFSALALVFLLSTAVTHLHKSALAAEDCTLCATVIDKVADLTVPPVILEPVAQLLPYRLLAVVPVTLTPAIPLLLPPVRGPPSISL